MKVIKILIKISIVMSVCFWLGYFTHKAYHWIECISKTKVIIKHSVSQNVLNTSYYLPVKKGKSN